MVVVVTRLHSMISIRILVVVTRLLLDPTIDSMISIRILVAVAVAPLWMIAWREPQWTTDH